MADDVVRVSPGTRYNLQMEFEGKTVVISPTGIQGEASPIAWLIKHAGEREIFSWPWPKAAKVVKEWMATGDWRAAEQIYLLSSPVTQFKLRELGLIQDQDREGLRDLIQGFLRKKVSFAELRAAVE